MPRLLLYRGKSPGQDRPARHRVAEAGVLGVAARGNGATERRPSVPTIAEEDAKRPNRERERLVGERTRIVNRMKGTLGPAGHSQLQTNPAQGGGASCNTTHPGGLRAAAECLGSSCSAI